jgi:hypothetical protein
MHQLAVGPSTQRLDADRLAGEVGKLLNGAK